RALSVCAPHRAERTMLGAAADGLHRGPHVTLARHQIPSRRHEVLGFNPATLVQRLEIAIGMISQDHRPGQVAVTFHYSVRAAQIRRFLRIKRGVNSAENNGGSTPASRVADLVSAQSVARVNADANDVASLDVGWFRGGKG